MAVDGRTSEGVEHGPAFGILPADTLPALLDWRDGEDRLDFSFQGFDEGDEVNGRGWVIVEVKLVGHIVFHMGDESGFTARKV